VASQVGQLIWETPSDGNADQAALVVPRRALTAVLAAVEECVISHRGGAGGDLLEAVANVRAALASRPAVPRTTNETQTEPRRPQER
jgi:hypothetical protein